MTDLMIGLILVVTFLGGFCFPAPGEKTPGGRVMSGLLGLVVAFLNINLIPRISTHYPASATWVMVAVSLTIMILARDHASRKYSPKPGDDWRENL